MFTAAVTAVCWVGRVDDHCGIDRVGPVYGYALLRLYIITHKSVFPYVFCEYQVRISFVFIYVSFLGYLVRFFFLGLLYGMGREILTYSLL